MSLYHWFERNIAFVTTAGPLSLGGTWGGQACYDRIDFRTHVYETSCWILVTVLCYYLFHISDQLSIIIDNLAKSQKTLPTSGYIERSLNLILTLIHFGMFIHLIYFKWNFKGLVNLLQPCHLILLLEGIALGSVYFRTPSDGDAKLEELAKKQVDKNRYMYLCDLISLLILPSLCGTFLATLFPDTNGLHQYLEKESYFVQHYLIQITPFHLLLREQGKVLKECSFATICIGLWFCILIHWTFFEVLDLMTMVNVEFMLCPTTAMDVIFSNDIFPAFLFVPTYRTTMCFVTMIIGTIVASAYIGISTILKRFVLTKSKMI
jgi:hypothetical protein